MVEIQAIAVELCDCRGANNHTFQVLELEDVQCKQKGLAEGRYEAVVRWRGEFYKVDLGSRACAGELSYGFAIR
jgi:hypothetical protein